MAGSPISDSAAASPAKNNKQKGWLMSRLTRNASSRNLQETAPGFTRKPSIGSFLNRRPKNTLAGHSLDTMYRLGGFSMFALPSSRGPIELLIPLPLAATAQYLLRHGTRDLHQELVNHEQLLTPRRERWWHLQEVRVDRGCEHSLRALCLPREGCISLRACTR